jgi:hypothetical protein
MIAVLLSVPLVGQAPPGAAKEAGEWVVIQSKEGRYSFAMPARPQESRSEQQTPVGKIKSMVYVCPVGESALVFRYQAMPRAAPIDQLAVSVETQMKQTIRVPMEVISRKAIAINGVPGRELIFTMDAPNRQGKITQRLWLLTADTNLYVIGASSGPGKPIGPEATAYLESLRLDGQPASKPAMAGRATPKATMTAKAATPAKPAPVPPKRKLIGRIDRVDTTSEAAFRTFLMAIEAGDEETLRAVTLPNPDVDWLLRGETPRGLEIADLKQRMLKARVQRLKPGDRVKLPGKADHVIGPDEVGRDRAALRMEGAPAYAPLRTVKGHWKVDPAPIIAASKAEATKADPKK